MIYFDTSALIKIFIPLRAFDAIHLASALILKKGIREPLPFAAADSRLLDAASAEHLTPWRIGL